MGIPTCPRRVGHRVIPFVNHVFARSDQCVRRGRRGTALRPRGRTAEHDPAAVEPPGAETRARRRGPAAGAGQPSGGTDRRRPGLPARGTQTAGPGRDRERPGPPGRRRRGRHAAARLHRGLRDQDPRAVPSPDVRGTAGRRRDPARAGHPGAGRRPAARRAGSGPGPPAVRCGGARFAGRVP